MNQRVIAVKWNKTNTVPAKELLALQVIFISSAQMDSACFVVILLDSLCSSH